MTLKKPPATGRSRRRGAAGLVGALSAATCLVAAAGIPAASATSSATLYAWGGNYYGQLGDGTANNQVNPEPTTLAPGISPIAISAGVGFSLAIGSDHNLYAWGTGYLGDGSSSSELSPEQINLASGVTPRAISAGGDDFSLAIGSDGNLYAWGSDLDGQLGDGQVGTNAPSPEKITLAPGVTPTAISAGYNTSLAIGSDGNLYAWGSNGSGQLGDGTTTDEASPEVIGLPTGVKPTAIAEGNATSYAIGSDGVLYAWGDNQFGQLGEHTTTGPDECGPAGSACSMTPAAVTVNVSGTANPAWAPLQATAVATSQENWAVMAIGSDGNLYGWGLNYSCAAGQLPDEYSPQVITLAPGVNPTAISAGECDDYAIGSDGNLYGWGWNANGELGDGTTGPETSPEEITLAQGVTPTAVDADYTFALAIGGTGGAPVSTPELKAPPTGLPEAPLTIGLPAAAAAILAAILLTARRRHRRASAG